MKILGIDPGLDRTGWAVLESAPGGSCSLVAAGLIHTAKGLPLPRRLSEVYDSLSAVIAEHSPGEAAIEEVFFSKRADTQANTTHARGVILLACEKARLPITGYNPGTIKKTVSGSGKAEKPQMQRMVQLTLSMNRPLTPDDVADAAAVGLCHARLAPVARRLAAARRAAC